MKSTSTEAKPSIVFAHGIWADGSCLQKLIPTLRAEGHEMIAAQDGLDTLKGDVHATVLSHPKQVLDMIRTAAAAVLRSAAAQAV
jgi:hypothetical protein